MEGGIMFRGFWGLKMVPQVPTVIDGYKKLWRSRSMKVTNDHFAPTPTYKDNDKHCYYKWSIGSAEFDKSRVKIITFNTSEYCPLSDTLGSNFETHVRPLLPDQHDYDFTCYTSVLTILEAEESDFGMYSCNFSYHDGVLEHRYRCSEPYAFSNINLITEDTEPSLSEGSVYNQGGLFQEDYEYPSLPIFSQCLVYGSKNISWYVAFEAGHQSVKKMPLIISGLNAVDMWQVFFNIKIFQYNLPYSDVTESFIVMDAAKTAKDFQLGCYLKNSGTTIHNNDNVIHIKISKYSGYIDIFYVETTIVTAIPILIMLIPLAVVACTRSRLCVTGCCV